MKTGIWCFLPLGLLVLSSCNGGFFFGRKDLSENRNSCTGVETHAGRKHLHRLTNRHIQLFLGEYFGHAHHFTQGFPPPGNVSGFSNMEGANPVEPSFLNSYYLILEKIFLNTDRSAFEVTLHPDEINASSGALQNDGTWKLYNGLLYTDLYLPRPGTYEAIVHYYNTSDGGNPDFQIQIGGEIQNFSANAPRELPKIARFRRSTNQSGPFRIGVAVQNGTPNRAVFIRTIDVREVKDLVQGQGLNLAHHPNCNPRNSQTPETCATQKIQDFSRNAWRRPPNETELSRHVQNILRRLDKLTYEESVAAEMVSILFKPEFLYRMETLQDGRRTPAEIATNLSFFVWDQAPSTLFLDSAISAFDLGQNENVLQLLELMLADPRAQMHEFGFRYVSGGLLSQSSNPLHIAFATETGLFFQDLFDRNAPVKELLVSKRTFLDGTLSSHYGFGGVQGGAFQAVSTEGSPYRGILTQGAFSAAHSDTVPTKGGHVVENILCIEIKDPPDGVPGIPDAQPGEGIRERLARHRTDVRCAACHRYLDPIGLGLMNFAQDGTFQETENGIPIDPADVFEGKAFANHDELIVNVLAEDPRFKECFTEKMLQTAIGRITSKSDHCASKEIAAQSEGDGLKSILKAVILSPQFLEKKHTSEEESE